LGLGGVKRDTIAARRIGGRHEHIKTYDGGGWNAPAEKCRHPINIEEVADPMNLWQNYHLAQSVKNALNTMIDAPESVQLIAGGTDLLLDLQQGRHPHVHTLVDITRVPEMTVLEVREGKLFIGAAVLHRTIAQSPLVIKHARALSIASGLIGGPQVRNTATIGGNVAHALPAADGTIALMALDAQAEIASLDGRRRIPLSEIFLSPGKSTLKPREEILVGVYLNLRKIGQASAFRRIMRPQGVAIAILNLGVWLHREGTEIRDVRISVGPSGPVPRRMKNTEDVLRDQVYGDEIVAQAYKALLGEANFRTSRHRATKEYRKQMVGVLLEDVLENAWQEAAGA
jgi:carbon-monoxide dehydrogenase medium subunit